MSVPLCPYSLQDEAVRRRAAASPRLELCLADHGQKHPCWRVVRCTDLHTLWHALIAASSLL